MAFEAMYDLESLTEAQRQEYYRAACERYRVPAELNLLAFIWLDSQDGKRTLTLYAKKGATDIIRGNLGISTTRLIKDIGDGYVAWIAEGKDRNGRIEQAVGSASTEGLKGQALASAVMIAQTRATRRMTLQFVGGLLDESELPSAVADIGRASAPLSTLATLSAPEQPIVAPNSSAGKDITATVPPTKFGGIILHDEQPDSAFRFEVRPDMKIATAPAPFANGDITPKQVETLAQVENPEPKKRRRRRTKAEMEAAAQLAVNQKLDQVTALATAPAQTIVEQAIEKVVDEQVHKAAAELGMTPAPTVEQAVISEVVEQTAVELATAVAEHTSNKELPVYPTKEQEDGFRKRMAHYTGDVLKKGGMADGIIWRVRKYMLSLFPDALVENGRAKLTVRQWEILLDGLDQQLKEFGPTELVKMINLVAEKV